MHISSLFGAGRPLFSFEFFPPKTAAGDQQLRQTIAELRALEPSFVSVTYGAGGATRTRTIDLVRYIKHEVGLEAMAHLTCVGASRAELSEVLDRLERAGIENVIALRGDPPKGQTDFVPHPDGLGFAAELVRMIRAQGRRFCLAAACYPETHVEAASPEADLAYLAEKVRAGVDFLITQLFLDNVAYFAFVDRARAAGIRVPILAGIMPLTNLDQAVRFGATVPASLRARIAACHDDAGAVERAMIETTTEQCRELLAGGAPGIHFYTLNKSGLTREVLTRLRADA